MPKNSFKMQYIFAISLISLISINFVNSECGCKKIKRIFGTEKKDGVCFYTDFLTIIHHPITRNMAKIPGGVYHIGTDTPVLKPDGEAPRRPVQLFDYYIDKFEVSVSDFAEFVNATGYQTDADRYGDSFVLYSLVKNLPKRQSVSAVASVPWWLQINGTNWAHPEGANSTIKGRWDHPVVHVSWNDATTYCSWLGKRLPTEAEWEVACRGSLEDKLFAWGDEFLINEKHQANTWQGFFPFKNTGEDGYVNTAPVDAFLQNKYGLYNIIGNVWEWTDDWWETKHSTTLKVDPKGPETGADKVKKGGSFMCHKDYCYRFRCAARSQNTVDTTSGNMGFRCAKSAIN